MYTAAKEIIKREALSTYQKIMASSAKIREGDENKAAS